MRKNAGYEIISAIRISDTEEVVLGIMETLYGTKYVTWDCTYSGNYFWGHYFDDFKTARNDHIMRAAGYCGLILEEKEA